MKKFTQQERLDGQRKRAEKRERLIAESENLKLDWMDKPEWERLSSQLGIRLPIWYEPAQPKFAKRALKKAGISQKEYEDLTGHNIKETITLNPRMPAFALVGFVLEDLRELDLIGENQG